MSKLTLHFQLPENLKVEKFIAKLGKKMNLQIASQHFSLKNFYDTFDWRLFSAGVLCELNRSKSVSQLSLKNLQDGQPIAVADLDDMPEFADDIQDGTIKAKLKPLMEMRALMSLTSLSYQAYRIDSLNKDEKTTVRLLIEEYELLPARVTILPMKGYDKAAMRLSVLLQKKMELSPPKKTVLQAALKLQGRKPMDYSSKLAIELEPNMRADVACKSIYSHLLRAMRVNESGVIADIDSEFLHDFRVAVRRTRAGLNQLKNILPPDVVARYSEFFAWLGQITSMSRDIDVYLLNFAAYQQSLPLEMQQDLVPLHEFLVRKKAACHKALVTKLQSAEYISGLEEWSDYLKKPVVKKPAESAALLPIKQVADKRIWKTYRRVLKEGGRIDDQSPAEALHQLRKTCKKLRYLMEFFQSLYPGKKITGLIKELKNFQNILGDFQDYEVQEQTLKKFGEEMMSEQTPANTFIAMGVLVQSLHQKRQQARAEFNERFQRFRQQDNQSQFTALFAQSNGGES